MSILYSTLGKICSKMKNFKFTRPFFQLLMKIGLVHFVYYLFCLWFNKHPTQKMNEEKRFFTEHAQELKEVYDSLENDDSRLVFENILKYRVTSDWAFLKRARGKDSLKTQYIVPELQLSDHEIIVDCGAFTGDTAKFFYKYIPGCKVIALEPEDINFKTLQKLKLNGLTAIKCGAWSEDTTLSFSDKGGGTTGGTIDTSGNIKIEVRALDNLPECQTTTYIKMDIEGAELEALKGAEKIIKKNRPKLAICLYHKPQDFFEIPIFIKNLNPEYKLFVHHHYYNQETILYAV